MSISISPAVATDGVLVAEVVPPPDTSIDLNKFLEPYKTPEGLLTVGILVVIFLILTLAGGNKAKITTGRTVGMWDKLSATNLALTQIKRRQSNKVTLWCGMPRYWAKGGLRPIAAKIQTICGSSPTLWLPHAERSILVMGAPGSGKTYSCINPAIESAISQGFPIMVYDKKGDQLELFGPLAARYGYKVRVFAPGELYTGVINPLDFMRDGRDSVRATQIARTINRNAAGGNTKGGDEFFSKAGDLFSTGLLQLVKSHPNPEFHDMVSVYSVLKLSNLIKRIDQAIQSGGLDEWVAPSFIQALAAKDAEKTISGIITTATATFSNFIQVDLLPAFLGKTDFDLQIKGKEIVFFKLDDTRRAAVGPMLAAAIEQCVVANLSKPRTEPLVVSIDEFPSLRLDSMCSWVNEYRSHGGCFILGIQSLEQLYEAYGDKLGAAIANACGTHMLFNPGTTDTAKKYAERYGEKEISLTNKSYSHSAGSRTTSTSETLHKMDVISIDQILRFPPGTAVVTNPGYSSRGEGSVPYMLSVPIPKSDDTRYKESKALWPGVEQALSSRARTTTPEQLSAALQRRFEAMQLMLPLPDEPGAAVKTSPPAAAISPLPEDALELTAADLLARRQARSAKKVI